MLQADNVTATCILVAARRGQGRVQKMQCKRAVREEERKQLPLLQV